MNILLKCFRCLCLVSFTILLLSCKSTTEPNRVADPQFSPQPGNYEQSQLVSISCTTSGAEIRYTTDGSTPPTNSAIYTQPFSVETGTIVKAIATKPGMESSSVITAVYGTEVHTPIITPSGGNYQLAQSVVITCGTEGASIRYTTNGSEPSENSALYAAPLLISGSATLKARAYKPNCTPSQTSTQVYTIQLALRSGCDTPGSARSVVIRNSYAYVADAEAGLQIIDLSNPDTPFVVGSCDTPGEALKVVVSGNFAYIADRYAGLQVVDISDPANPFIAGSLPTTTNSECRGVAVAGNYLYINNPLQVVNISNPANPLVVETCNIPTLLDGMTIAGDYIYAAGWHMGLVIVNISNPLSLYLVGSANTGYYAWDVAVSGDRAFVADSDAGLFVFSISDPAHPVQIANLEMQSNTQGVFAEGNRVYVADGGWGLKIVDVFSPANPVQIGFCDTPSWAYGVAVSGNLVCVADGESGLQLLSLQD